ncbi:MAG TPA: histone deacetylase [Solirubrobacteraceae bacterium]|nr:histone deacetylase [Solirubrobacteraceae bacterium]
MNGLLYSHPACLEHDPGVLSPGHPDTPQRLATLERALAEHGWLGWERRSAPAASEAQLELVHSAEHVRGVRELCAHGGGAIDPDTFAMEASFRAATHAAGASLALAGALLAGEAQAGFCAVRPAGHHAERARAMGFCLFNNVAVAAAGALAELDLSRVFVLDWDVHHGNGTAEIFYARRDVLFASIHQWPLYPGSGRTQERGSGEGEGYTLNLPVPPGSGEALWLGLLDRVVLPAAAAYEPQLILISAGFDGHERDPLANCCLTTRSFVEMTVRVRELARTLGVGVGMVLEGGYNIPVLAECVLATLPALTGDEQPGVAAALAPREEELVAGAVAQARNSWPV